MKYIFEVTVKPGYTVEQYAQAWVEASKIIQQAEGARGTYLHRKLGDPSTVLAVAHWRSKADRNASQTLNDPRVNAIIEAQAQYCEIRLVGEFDEPEWAVNATCR